MHIFRSKIVSSVFKIASYSLKRCKLHLQQLANIFQHKSQPGQPKLLIQSKLFILEHFRSKIIPTIFKNASFLLKMQNSNYAYSAISQHILSPSPDLADLNYSKDLNCIFWNIFGPNKFLTMFKKVPFSSQDAKFKL